LGEMRPLFLTNGRRRVGGQVEASDLGPRKLSLWRRSRRPRLRDPEPIQELHCDIGTGTHRFVVRALDINRIVALLDAKMGSLGGWRRALAPRRDLTAGTAARRLWCLPDGSWPGRLWGR
jgi:hypothetical protein